MFAPLRLNISFLYIKFKYKLHSRALRRYCGRYSYTFIRPFKGLRNRTVWNCVCTTNVYNLHKRTAPLISCSAYTDENHEGTARIQYIATCILTQLLHQLDASTPSHRSGKRWCQHNNRSMHSIQLRKHTLVNMIAQKLATCYVPYYRIKRCVYTISTYSWGLILVQIQN